MNIGKALAGGVLVAAPVFGFASPAGADAEGNDRVEFDRVVDDEGTEHTCTFVGSSRYDYDEESDITWITASNAVSGADPYCGSGIAFGDDIFYSDLVVSWREPNEEELQNLQVDFQPEPNGSFTFSVDGRATSIDVDHQWRYRCPQATDHCLVGDSTNPK